MHVIKSVLLLGALAGLTAAPAGSAPPGDANPKDVTITVVNDPEQLNEKVNRISLPPAIEEPPHASPKPGKNADPSKQADHTQEKAAQDANGPNPDVGDSSQSDAESATQDIPDVPPPGPEPSEDAGGG
jgi:hypothetical protein